MNDGILLDCEQGIATVTLNRPGAMNALSRAVRSALARTMAALDQDDDIRVVILTGAGERAFTAGLDLKELRSGFLRRPGHWQRTSHPDPALPFGEAMALEHHISSQMNATVTPGAVKANRHAVLARDRSQ